MRSSCVTQVYQITTRDLRFKLHSPSPRPPLRIENFLVTPHAAQPRPGSAVFATEYGFDAYDSRAKHIATAALTLVAICATTPECTKTDLELFAAGRLLQMLHPYLTETVHTYTSHLGLPPLLLDIFQPSTLNI